MLIVTATVSIIILTVVVWVIRKMTKLDICPVCAGVAGTWVWLMIAHFGGYRIDLIIPAMLMGGSVVGVMSKLERLIELKFVLIWKTIFVVSGFWAMNSLINGRWLMVVAGIILATIVTLVAKMKKTELAKEETESARELKDKMKNCC